MLLAGIVLGFVGLLTLETLLWIMLRIGAERKSNPTKDEWKIW